MPDKAWKAYERRGMKILAGKRLPSDGTRGRADGVSSLFGVQFKKGRDMPAYLADWLAGIVRWAHRNERCPLVVWQRWKKPDLESLVILRLGDLVQLMENLNSDWKAIEFSPEVGRGESD